MEGVDRVKGGGHGRGPPPAISWVENTVITECTQESGNQREGMGLLVYQAMPSLRDLAHDGVLCTFSNRSAPDRSNRCGPQGWWHGPPTTYKITPCWVIILQPSRRAAVLGNPLAFALIGGHLQSTVLSSLCLHHRVHRVETAVFWRTSIMRVKLAQAGEDGGCTPTSLHLPSPVKLQCTLQLSGQTH
jgi:hypothetical protein